jgi:hypothetical protein
MNGPQILARRRQAAHLNHGPIDLIIQTLAARRTRAFAAASARFQMIPKNWLASWELRRPGHATPFAATANRMEAQSGFHPEFITRWRRWRVRSPTIMAAICAADLDKAYVNNGGDIAIHLPGNGARGRSPAPATAADRLDPCCRPCPRHRHWRLARRSFSLGTPTR